MVDFDHRSWENSNFIGEARAISVKPHMFVYKANKSTLLCWAFIWDICTQTINYATSNHACLLFSSSHSFIQQLRWLASRVLRSRCNYRNTRCLFPVRQRCRWQCYLVPWCGVEWLAGQTDRDYSLHRTLSIDQHLFILYDPIAHLICSMKAKLKAGSKITVLHNVRPKASQGHTLHMHSQYKVASATALHGMQSLERLFLVFCLPDPTW